MCHNQVAGCVVCQEVHFWLSSSQSARCSQYTWQGLCICWEALVPKLQSCPFQFPGISLLCLQVPCLGALTSIWIPGSAIRQRSDIWVCTQHLGLSGVAVILGDQDLRFAWLSIPKRLCSVAGAPEVSTDLQLGCTDSSG